MRQVHGLWTSRLAHVTYKIAAKDAELLLLPPSIGMQKSMAMIDSGATQNLLSTTMVEILKSTVPECISW